MIWFAIAGKPAGLPPGGEPRPNEQVRDRFTAFGQHGHFSSSAHGLARPVTLTAVCTSDNTPMGPVRISDRSGLRSCMFGCCCLVFRPNPAQPAATASSHMRAAAHTTPARHAEDIPHVREAAPTVPRTCSRQPSPAQPVAGGPRSPVHSRILFCVFLG